MTRKLVSLCLALVLLLSSFVTTAFAIDEGSVLCEGNGIKVTYLGYEMDEYGSFYINTLVENNSSKAITVEMDDESINGYAVSGSLDTLFGIDVAAGEKKEIQLEFEKYKLLESYISSVQEVEFSVSARASDDIFFNALIESRVKISLGGIALNNGVSADTRAKKEVFNENGVVLYGLGCAFNEFGEFDVQFLIENNTAKTICTDAFVSVNGYMCNGLFASNYIAPGKKCYESISISEDDFKNIFVSTINKIEYSFEFQDDMFGVVARTPVKSVEFPVGGLPLDNGVSADTRSKTMLVNRDGVAVSYIGQGVNALDEPYVELFIENNSEKTIYVNSKNAHVNGNVDAPMMYATVFPGEKAYAEVTFCVSEVEKTVSTVDFDLVVYDDITGDVLFATGMFKIANGVPQLQNNPAPSADPNEVKVVIDGKPVVFDVKPVINDGRTLVPLRAIFEALGATVDWEPHTRTVISQKGSTEISLQVGSTQLYVNGVAKTLDVPAKIIDGRTLVPVRAISEAFGCGVDWVAATKTVVITQ